MAQHPNVELVRRGYAAFAALDLDGALQDLADDVLWHAGGDGPLSGDYKGKQAVSDFFVKIFEFTGGTIRFDVVDIFADDHHAVVRAHETATRARDGASLEMDEAHVFHLRDGKVVEFWDLPDDPPVHDGFFT
jgi:ketosteroid isomerase-like protein